ncbi:nuclear transport factor 2 family protein [Mycolicibacterium sp. XJ870]
MQVRGGTLSDSAASVIRKFLGCFPRSDVDEMVGFFSDDAVYIDGPRGVHRGIDAIRTELQSIFAMVPSTTVDIKTLAISDGTVLAQRVDNIEIEGKPIGIEAVGVFDVDSNGRITRWRDYYDLPTLMDQVAAAIASPS